jgi:hypothetical protein
MNDIGEQLRRASEALPSSVTTLERLSKKQHRQAGHKRLAAGSVGLAMTLAIVGGIASLRGTVVQPAAGTLFTASSDQLFEREIRTYVLNDSGTSVTELRGTLSWNKPGTGTSDEKARMVFFDPADRAAYEASHGVDTGWQSPGGLGTGGNLISAGGVGNLSSLPTDPVQLKQWILDGNAPVGGWQSPALDVAGGTSPGTTDAWVWHLTFWDILHGQMGAPQLRSAAVGLASGLDGVVVNRSAVDPAGRPAISLHLVYDLNVNGWGSADEWIYADPTTLAPLALVESGGTEIIIVATDQMVSADSGDIVQTFVPHLDGDQQPFPNPTATG